MRLLHLFAFIALFPSLAYAQGDKISASAGLMQIFFGLAFVIALMIFAAWLFKRIGPVNTNAKIAVKIVGGVSIGTRERIMVVEVADQWIVVGVTGSQINTLSTMPKQEISAIETDTQIKENPFADWLKKTIEKRKANQA